MKSLTAAPSFRNSGFEATSNGILQPRLSISSRITALTFCAVPTGTVLLVTSTVYFLDIPPERAGHFQHVFQVGRAVLVGRCAYGREDYFHLVQTIREFGREVQTALFDIAPDEFFEPRLV